MTLDDIVRSLRGSSYFRHKTDIGDVLSTLEQSLPDGMKSMAQAIAIGDDCAAIPDGDGYLLFAIEGMTGEFVREMPWFAGYSAVMVNVSDIYAMGGRPLAVVDALWSAGSVAAEQLLQGMVAASKAYGIPIVGGHSNTRSSHGQLAVSILGRAKQLLTSFNAHTGDKLMVAIDMRGRFEGVYPYWNASVKAPPARLRDDLEILPQLAESGLCDAAKDISMAGVLGTALMLLECSRVGAEINMERLPIPPQVPLMRWLSAFPSYGFVLSVRPQHEDAVRAIFNERYLTCETIGVVTDATRVMLRQGDEQAMLWDFDQNAFILPNQAGTYQGNGI